MSPRDFSSTDSADVSVRRRLYASGDTLLIEELNEIQLRFAAIDTGVLQLGGTRLLAGWHPFGLTVTFDARRGGRGLEPAEDDFGAFR